MMRIGLLGGTGRVGRILLLKLLQLDDVAVVVGARSSDSLNRLTYSLPDDRVSFRQLDVLNDEARDRFCERLDIVINCAGPSGVVLDRVIKSAWRTRCALIDPGGYDPVVNTLQQYQQKDETAPPLIVGAGLLPGLSGIYPRWLISNAETTPQRLDIFYAGNDAWGPSSAWDIIHSTADFGANRPPCFYQKGMLVPVSLRRAFRSQTFPDPIGSIRGFMVYTEELGRLASQTGVQEVHCHGANCGYWSSRVLALAKLLRLNQGKRRIAMSARILSWASERDQRKGQQPCFAIDCQATWKDRTRRATVMTGDTYEGTAAILHCITRMVMNGHVHGLKKGSSAVGMAHEVVDSVKVMRALRDQGCIVWEGGDS